VTYGKFQARIADATDGTEDGSLYYYGMKGGTLTRMLQFTPGSLYVNPDGNTGTDWDFRHEAADGTMLIYSDAGLSRVGVGAAPVTGGAQFQVDEDAAFLRPVLTKTATYTPMPAEEAYGHIFNMNNTTGGAIVLGLPPAVEGMHLSVILGGTDEVTLTPSGSEVLNAETGGNTLTLSTVLAKWDIICYRDAYWSVTRSVFAS